MGQDQGLGRIVVIRPLRDRIVVRPLDAPLSTVIEVIQHKDADSHCRGQVLAVGPSVKFGKRYRPRTPTDTQVGDTVHFTEIYKFPAIDVQGERVHILQEADVCGIEVKAGR